MVNVMERKSFVNVFVMSRKCNCSLGTVAAPVTG